MELLKKVKLVLGISTEIAKWVRGARGLFVTTAAVSESNGDLVRLLNNPCAAVENVGRSRNIKPVLITETTEIAR